MAIRSYRILGLTEGLESTLRSFFFNQTGREMSESQARSYIAAFRVAVLLIVLFLTVDFAGHWHNFPLGTYGDFFGGLVNPLITGASLIALALTIVMQGLQLKDVKSESAEAKLAIRKQAFDTSFFNMLELHNSIVLDLKFKTSIVETSWARMKGVSYSAKDSLSARELAIGRKVFDEVLWLLDYVGRNGGRSLDAYKLLQDQHNDILGHYFRNLYQILKYIDRTSKELKDKFDAEFYSGLLRAQLSANELLILLYNCSGKIVDGGEFRKLLITYHMLEHIPLHWDDSIKVLRPPSSKLYDQTLYEQYLSYEIIHNTGRKTGGAFGDNPAVAAYIRHLELT